MIFFLKVDVLFYVVCDFLAENKMYVQFIATD